ncbi:DUF3565 domain-containing protein [Shewanella pneumatophori]
MDAEETGLIDNYYRDKLTNFAKTCRLCDFWSIKRCCFSAARVNLAPLKVHLPIFTSKIWVNCYLFRRFAMQQPIVSYHKDDEDHWVANLSCGHSQHVRHRPPWEIRNWVTSQQGRDAMLGYNLDCKLCERDLEVE